MHSIKTRITAMTVCAVVIAMAIAAAFGVKAIRDIGNYNAEQTLLLLCETGNKDLDYFFQNVESSVKTVAAFVQSDLDGVDDEALQAHIDRVSDVFQKLAYNTNGVLTYYYRIDPEVSGNVKGFWYVNSDGNGFKAHEVTDITEYDTDDTSSLVWFTVPKATGEGVWLPPYITENLYARVISYNVPVYYDGQFIGVIGIEIDYSTMAEVVNHITLYENGYAFLNDDEGNIIYHPRMDVTTMEAQPQVPSGLLSNDKFIRYFYDGVEKRAVCLPLSNGMRLVVTVPVQEINTTAPAESSAIVAARVNAARMIQLERYRGTGKHCNAQLNNAEVKRYCAPDAEAVRLLDAAVETMHLSMRAYQRILKVARTIADLEHSQVISSGHIAEAIQYRELDQKYWR